MTLVDVLARSAAPAIPPGAGSDGASGSSARAFADVLEDALGVTTGGTETVPPTETRGEPTSAAPQSADPALVAGGEIAGFPPLSTVGPEVAGAPVAPFSSDESGITDGAPTEGPPSAAATAPPPLTATAALALIPTDTGASSASAVVGQAVDPLPVAEAPSAAGVNGAGPAPAAPGTTRSSSRTAFPAPAVTAPPAARIPTGPAEPGASPPASDATFPSSPGLAHATPADSVPERSAPASVPKARAVEPHPSVPSQSATTTSAFAPVPTTAPAASTAVTVSSPAPMPASPPPLPPQVSGAVVSLARAGDGDHRLTLTVSPENLGPVTVRAHIVGGAIHIELHAPSDAGREALRAVLADLRRDLAAAAPHASLAVATSDTGTGAGSGSSSSNPWSTPGSSSGSPQGGGPPTAADRGSGRRDHPAPSDPAPTPAPRPTPHAGAVDVYA